MRIRFSNDPTCRGKLAGTAYLAYILRRPDDLFGQFSFVVGGVLFAYLFLVGRLIPRWIA